MGKSKKSVVEPLLAAYTKHLSSFGDVSICSDPSSCDFPLMLHSSYTRWRRLDGVSFVDPDRIIASVASPANIALQVNFYKWLVTQPNVKPIGKIKGSAGSCSYDFAVVYKGIVFIDRNIYTECSTLSRLNNSSVWHRISNDSQV